jgi:hypothetical protein
MIVEANNAIASLAIMARDANINANTAFGYSLII